MKSAVLPEPHTILSVDSPNVYVSESAQRRLDALRSSVDVRLAALEAALADPSRGEALEGLILDLAQVACEEAQAAAAHGCADTRLEAETHIAQARAAAQAAIDQEFASSAEVRQALEEARQHVLVLQHEKEEALTHVREGFELELAKERAARTEVERAGSRLERSVADVQNELHAERSLTANLRQELDRLDAQTRELKHAQSEAASLSGQLQAEIARGREALSDSQRAHAETQTQLAVERNSVSELRRNAERAAEQLAQITRREAEARGAHEHITKVYDETVAELRREREAYAQLRDTQKKLQAQLDADQSTSAEVGRSQHELQERLTVEQVAVSDLRRALSSLQDQFDSERAAAASHAKAESDLRGEVEAARATASDLKHALAELQNRFDGERATTAELRRETAQAEARMQSAVDAEHAVRAQLAESARRDKGEANASAADAAQLAAATSQIASLTADLDRERGAVADLRAAQDEREKRWEKDRSTQADRATEQLAALTSKLEAAQRSAADLRQQQSDLEARLATERAASAELRQDLARTQERGQSGPQDVQSVREALAHARSEVQSLRDELETARAKVETVLGERADTERLWHEAESRLKRTVRERDEFAARVQGGPGEVAGDAAKGAPAPSESSKNLPTGTPLSVLPHPATKTAQRPPTKPVGKSREPEHDWVAVRMSPRYGFGEPTAIQINGQAGQLCDLSIGGCQVLSQVALKPNQTVKIALPTGPKPLSCSGKIVWAKLEAPAFGRPAGYRAGVQFSKPDHAAIEAFITNHHAKALV